MQPYRRQPTGEDGRVEEEGKELACVSLLRGTKLSQVDCMCDDKLSRDYWSCSDVM